MNRLALSVSFLLLSVFLLNPITQAQDKDCEPGNTKNTAYMQRENERRCEGINTPKSGKDFDLISLVIGKLQPTETLTLQIPKVSRLPEPNIRVQSPIKSYQLIPLELKDKGNQWQFQWENDVLFDEKIPPSSLRSIAEAENIVIPVRLSQPNPPVYDIRIHTGSRAKNITLKIQQTNGNEVYSKTLNNQPGDEVQFSWDGKNKQGKIVPAGRYILTVDALLERKNDSPKNSNITRQFEHNPSWLKDNSSWLK